jgi:glycogen(starch) synthase
LVLERAPETRFVLVGGHRHCSGEDMATYWCPAEFEKYREQVRFTGWLSSDDLAGLYRQADMLVVPSWYEPFGMVVLEGMLYGLPIAASAIGGPAEILEHERTGLLYPPRDARAIAGALVRLIKDPALRQRLGHAAAREVRQTWLYSRVVRRIWAVYAEMLTARRSISLIATAPAGQGDHFPIARQVPHAIGCTL